MEAKTYYITINQAAQDVFNQSISRCDFLGSIHDYSTSLQDWSHVLSNSLERQMLDAVVEQIEISCLSLLSGLYRQSFASLRLSLELIFGMVYFSAHQIEFLEWKRGGKDLLWGVINDEENGVLSPRFTKAFFPEVSRHAAEQRIIASKLYRSLSEFVHGNFATWNPESPALSLNDAFMADYEKKFGDFRCLTQFLLCLRYLNELNQSDRDKLEVHIIDEFRSLPEIRTIFGGPVE